ncbi:hypothetical protein JNB63_05240 [Microbacterium trichothecenolyticum]|uniref:hypothetical protein n=1 Tax=Microbacterium trichothecenolyticum TaxID=69370 RepID=UPI001C6E98AC|nr:hypothetical protein [Microbacterium trichothecenolyticum]MBW9119492.1 hypothetical protein [Microbacterium trichothecenolyticum]
MADPWSDLDTSVPLLLVPVRVETQSRESAAGDGSIELLVRIYPDDVAIDDTASHALLMPDFFRVIAVQGGDVSIEDGAPIGRNDDLGLGLGHIGEEAGDTEFEVGAQRLGALASGAPGGDAAWLTDYRAALDRGFAVTLTLNGGRARIDRLYVIGARSGTPDDSADDVVDALNGHARAELVGAGTPTNNTEAARAATPPTEDISDAASLALARALGVADLQAFDDWPRTAADPDLAGAMAMALWPVTWGRWLRDAWRPRRRGLTVFDRIDLRDHVERFVRPEGPLPVLRIDRQPYGMLPTCLTEELVPDDRIEQLLIRVARAVWPLWASAPLPPSVHDGDLADTLPRILGLAPASRNVRARRALRTDGPLGASIRRTDPDSEEERRRATRELEERLRVEPGSLRQVPHLGGVRMLGLPLVHDSDADALARLVEGTGDVGEESVLQMLLTAARENARAEARAARAAIVRHLDIGPELLDILDRDPTGREAAGIRDEIVGQLTFWWEQFAAPQQPGGPPRLGDDGVRLADLLVSAVGPDLFDIDTATLDTLARDILDRLRFDHARLVDAVRGSPLLDRFRIPGPDLLTQARELLALLLEYLDALDTAHRTRTGIARLAQIHGDAHRQRLLAGALDAASHRLDAWVTALATRRLARLRRDQPRGIALGAYAWLEDITLDPRPADPDTPVESRGVGWIQAPSPTHAATAALLRSARLTHAPHEGAESPFEIDLSSTRTREAVDIVRGMAQGQELGALLGYRFERWLHEHDKVLNRLVPALRAHAPLVVGRETPPSPANGAAFALTGAVVDGLVLLQKRAGLRTALQKEQTYEGWSLPTEDELRAVDTLVERLERLADAVSDLMLAEGVHQLAAGATARAAAAMDALSGDVPPEEPDVPRSPAERQGITQRVAVLSAAAGTAPGPAGGWAHSIRSRAHPFWEAWCRAVLGRADQIALRVRPDGGTVNLSAVDISALDFVLAADGSETGLERFWQRCRRRRGGLPETPVRSHAQLGARRITLHDAWQLASAARAVLENARALEPDDLVAAGSGNDIARHEPETAALATRRIAVIEELEELAGLPLPTRTAPLLRRADDLALVGLGGETDPGSLGGEPTVLTDFVAGLIAALRARIAAAQAAEDPAVALAEVVGRVPVVPDLRPPPDPALPGALVDADALPTVRRWLARMTHVRPAVARFSTLSALRVATQRAAGLGIAVFGADRWVGDGEAPDGAATQLVFERMPGFDATGVVAGFVVDQWAEHRPALRRVGEGREPRQLVSTGLAIHADAPAARAPHALLLGVSPDGGAWSEARILALLDEVRALALMRLATPGDLGRLGELLPAIAVTHWSLIDENVIDPRGLAGADRIVSTYTKAR